jgi:threonine dehydratase
VSEERVRDAIRLLASEHRLVAEGAGALALAAAIDTPLEDRGPSVCLVTGGNIPAQLLDELLDANPK